MYDLMHDYTAGELLHFLAEEDISEYIQQEIEETNDGDTIVIDVLDVERVENEFMYHVRRYVSVKRGYKFYIHDNKSCNDIMMFKFNRNNEEEIQNHVNNICRDLNERKVSFIGKKHRCDF